MEGLCGTAVPHGSGLSAGRTGSLAQVVVGAYGGPAGDVSSQRRRPTSWEDRESCQSGGWCLWRARRGWHFPTARAHQLGGRGVLPRWWSVPMEGLRGRAVANGPGSPARGTGSTAEVVVGAYGGPAGDGTSQRPGPTSWGDGESCPGSGRCPWRACGGGQFPAARTHQLGGRGVLPRWRLVPMEGLRGIAVPNGPGPPHGGTGSLAQTTVGAFGGRLGDGSPPRPGPRKWGDGESYPHDAPNGPGSLARGTGSLV